MSWREEIKSDEACGSHRVSGLNYAHNKRIQRRPRSEFLMYSSVSFAAPLMQR